jgi:hypothetical protein
MRQLTVEELGFVSGGFGGMADQTIVDSELLPSGIESWRETAVDESSYDVCTQLDS